MNQRKFDESNVPPRIILSRKGIDTTKGGGGGRGSSPIIKERIFSIPIPESPPPAAGIGMTYGQLAIGGDWLEKGALTNVGELLHRLGRRNINAKTPVHLDPDIRPFMRPDCLRNLPMYFGQSESSLTELDCVRPRDMFLFFGRFQSVNTEGPKWRWDGKPKHIIWGWLQVGTRVSIDSCDNAPDDAKHHPHVAHLVKGERPYGTGKNVLFKASDRLELTEKLSGAGVFPRLRASLVLTSQCRDCRSDWWQLPKCFFAGKCAHGRASREVEPCGHNAKNIPKDYCQANFTGQGQEFVFSTKGLENKFVPWLESIFDEELFFS